MRHRNPGPPTALRQRISAGNPLPAGTLPVGAGLIVSGLSAYGFLVVAARALGPVHYAPVQTLWTLVFVAAPGCFLPLEQEIGRALSARLARGQGGLPVLQRAAVLGTAIAALIIAAALVTAGPVTSTFFGGNAALVPSLCVSVAVYAAFYLLKGTLGGTARFSAYGALVALEGSVRLLVALVLGLFAVRSEGWFGVCMWVAPAVAVLAVVGARPPRLEPGPEAPWGELSQSLGLLLTASLAAQLLVNASLLAVRALPGSDDAGTSAFGVGLIMTRLPLFFFQAVQAALLPRLSAMLAQHRLDDFRRLLERLLVALTVLVVLFAGGTWLLGQRIISLLFGSAFALGGGDLAWLALGSGMYMLGLALGQAAIATGGQRAVAVCWTASVAVFLVALALPGTLVGRAEHAFVAATVLAVLSLGGALLRAVRMISDRVARPGAAGQPA